MSQGDKTQGREEKRLIDVEPHEESDDLGRKLVATFDGSLFEVYLRIPVVPNKWWLDLWELYETSMDIKEAVQDQRVYSLQQFFEAMIDPDYIKYPILMDGEPVGLVMGTTDPEKMRVNYVNPDFIRARYPDALAKKRVVYGMVTYFSPKIRSFGFYGWLVRAILESYAEICDVYVTDVADSRLSLKAILEQAVEESGIPFKTEVLGTQTYFALSKLNP